MRHPAQIDLAVTLAIFDFFPTYCRALQKNTAHEIENFVNNFSGSISMEITQKAENDIVKRYRSG